MDSEVKLEVCPFCGRHPHQFTGGAIWAPEAWAACYGSKEGSKHEYIAMPVEQWNTRQSTQLDGWQAEWANERAAMHHRLAHENPHLRVEHIASSSAYRDLAEAILASAAISALGQHGQGEEARRTFRHKKRGTVYTVIGVGRAQGSLADDDPIVLYRGEDGSLWARHQVEFCDGRFEEIITTALHSQGEGSGESAVQSGEAVVGLRQALVKLEAAGTQSLEALDAYNRKHETFLGGPSMFKLGVAIADARAALAATPTLNEGAEEPDEKLVEKVARAIAGDAEDTWQLEIPAAERVLDIPSLRAKIGAKPERMTYAPPGLEYAAVDQNDLWLLRFADQDCGDQWFGGEGWTAEEARSHAIDAWNRYAPAWSVRLMRTVTLDEIRATLSKDSRPEPAAPVSDDVGGEGKL